MKPSFKKNATKCINMQPRDFKGIQAQHSATKCNQVQPS